MVYLRQETNAVGHQNTCLDRKKEEKNPSLSVVVAEIKHCSALTLPNKSNNTAFLRQEVNYYLKVKCQEKYTALVSQISFEKSTWTHYASYYMLI